VRLAQLAHEAGWPAGGLNAVLLAGADAAPLVTDERPAMITFTGSPNVGWDIKNRCGRKKVALELGGNAAAIIEPDADWQIAAERLAVCAFAYAGQSCISVQRIFVHHAIADRFIPALVEATRRIPTGNPATDATVCGPLIDRPNAERVEQWIADAAARGARILCGNERHGNVVTPTLVADVPAELPLSCHEVFGPVATVDTYKEFEDALLCVNDSRYGLQAGIFTNDWRRIWQAYETLEVGGVIHNDAPTFRVDAMPYGGVKLSGMGREGARWAIQEMTEPRLLLLSTA
jgi:acyl-CoA reductase-like NAD-dependent aldehyde dehydrogenase